MLATTAHVGHNTGDSEWFTPANMITLARKVLGGIDLDPASTAAANRVVKAAQFYTATEDGLTLPWRGRVWMNPPYAHPAIEQFTSKLVESARSGSVPAAMILVNNATVNLLAFFFRWHFFE